MSPVDRTAHLNRWRNRALAEKALLSLGMLLPTIALPPFPAAVLVAVAMTVAALIGARVPWRLWLGVGFAPMGFAVTGALSLVVQWGDNGLSLAPHGIEDAAALLLRSWAGVSCLLFLSLTTPATDLIGGLRKLGIPAELAEIALLVYRFVFQLADIAAAMHASQAARLGHVGWKRRLRSLGLLAANLMPRAFDRAHRLEIGLAARGWQGEMRVLSPKRPLSAVALGLILLSEAAVWAVGVLA